MSLTLLYKIFITYWIVPQAVNQSVFFNMASWKKSKELEKYIDKIDICF